MVDWAQNTNRLTDKCVCVCVHGCMYLLLSKVEEFIALVDPKLQLFTGEEEMTDSYDDRPQHKLTHFT